MSFRSRANIDPNHHKGLILQNANGLGGLLVPTAHSLTNSIAVSVAIVDSSGSQISSFGGGTQYVDGVTQAGPTGTVALAKDATNVLKSLSIDGSGNLLVAVTGAGSGGTSSVDGSAYTAGTSAGTALMGARDDTSPGTVAEDKLGIARITTNRALHVNLRDASGNEVSVGGGTQYADAAARGSATGTLMMVDDGTNIQSAAGNTAGELIVQAKMNGTWNVTNAGTFAVQATEADGANTTLGAKADAKNAATDTTAVSAMSVLKQISASVQAPPAQTANIGTTGGLALDATLTGGTQQSKITDGTQIANTVAGDAGNNGLVAHSARKEVTYSLTTATNSTAVDVSNYAYVSVHVIAQGTGATITFQSSNDNTNWVSVGLTSSASTGSAPVTLAGAATTGIFHGPLPGRYFRVNCTGISAGTSSGTIEFFSAGRSPQTVGGAVNQAGTWTVQPGNTANTTPWLTTQTPKTSGGLTTYHLVSAATTNATVVKASAGQVFGWYIYNSNAAARKLVFHNASTTPTAGASVLFAIMIPPTSAANVEFTNGIAFSTGIAITTVTDLTDAGATAVAANDLILNIFYS